MLPVNHLTANLGQKVENVPGLVHQHGSDRYGIIETKSLL